MSTAWPIELRPVSSIACAAFVDAAHGKARVTILVRATFTFAPDEAVTRVEPEPFRVDELRPSGGVEEIVLDPFRPRVEVTLVGQRHAPPGETGALGAARFVLTRGSNVVLDRTLGTAGNTSIVVATSQRIDFLGGDEELLLEGFHPRLHALRAQLPGARALGCVRRARGQVDPLPFVAEALHIDAERTRCALIWRAQIDVADEAELRALIVDLGVESAGAPVALPALSEAVRELARPAITELTLVIDEAAGAAPAPVTSAAPTPLTKPALPLSPSPATAAKPSPPAPARAPAPRRTPSFDQTMDLSDGALLAAVQEASAMLRARQAAAAPAISAPPAPPRSPLLDGSSTLDLSPAPDAGPTPAWLAPSTPLVPSTPLAPPAPPAPAARPAPLVPKRDDAHQRLSETLMLSPEPERAPPSLAAPFPIAPAGSGPASAPAPRSGTPWSPESARPVIAPRHAFEHTLVDGLDAPIEAPPAPPPPVASARVEEAEPAAAEGAPALDALRMKESAPPVETAAVAVTAPVPPAKTEAAPSWQWAPQEPAPQAPVKPAAPAAPAPTAGLYNRFNKKR